MDSVRLRTGMKLLLRLVALFTILGASYGTWLLLRASWQSLLAIDKEIAATLIATSGTVLAAVGTLVYGQRRAKEREIAEAHRHRKVEIYTGFMGMIVDVLQLSKERERDPSVPDVPANIEKFFYTFTRDSIVWASPQVIQRWYRFKESSHDGQAEALLLIDDILRAIRKDLGNSNRGLKRGHLIRLFLTDPEKLDKAMR